MEEKKLKKFRPLLIALILFIFVLVLFYVTDQTGKGQEISIEPGVYQLIEANKVDKIYVNGGQGRILLKDSDIDEGAFPSRADYYFTYGSTSDLNVLAEFIREWNSKNTAVESQVIYISKVAEASFIEKAMPYISIIILLVFGYFLLKTILGANSKNLSFGKTKARMAQNIKVTFNDVAGIDEEKEELQEVVEFLKNPQKFTELGAKIPKGILLVGQPGTGKTLLAKAIAGESNVPFFSISGSDFVEMFVGVGASRVRDLFDQAKKNSPCIVFIDEIDAVGRQRGAGLGGGNDEREQTLNQLLVQMDGFEPNEGIIVIAATNRSDVLDPALLRPGRFDRQIYVNPPDVKGREKIIAVHAKNKPLDSTVNFEQLARLTSGFTGADIENLLNEAAIYAAKKGKKKITMTDITEGINKVLMGPQKRSRIITEADKKITAFHESGHAIVGKLLKNCDNVQEVSIIPRGAAAGYTISRPENDDNHMTYNKLNDMIAMMLAGRVAEELVLKDISTGAQNDIERATKIATKMVTCWGMSKELGTVNLGTSSEIFVGRDYQTQKLYSEATASKIDNEVKAIIETNYQRAKELLKKNLAKLNVMANVLISRETIYSSEVDMIMKGKKEKEIIKEMDKLAEKNKRQNELDVAQSDLERTKKEQGVRLKTAEALKAAGVISEEEFEKVKSETQKLIDDAQKKYDEVVSKNTIKEDTNNTKLVEKPQSDNKETTNKKTHTTRTKTESKISSDKKQTAARKTPTTRISKEISEDKGKEENKETNKEDKETNKENKE